MSEESLFGAWVKERRKALDLTQEDLAERAACSAVAITRIERGTLRASQQLAAMLADALHISPNERARFLRLARGVAPGAWEAEEPAQASDLEQIAARPATNLPVSLTPLIGRDQDIAEVTSLLLPVPNDAGHSKPHARLLTLTGAPGIGKTSLALEVTRLLLPTFQDGAFFVPLAPISEPAEVMPAVMQALGLSEVGKRSPLTQLADYLRDRHIMLLLDNFEQVVGVGPHLLELLSQCARVQLVITSREGLHVRGERVYAVQPLALPDETLLARRYTRPGDLPMAKIRDYPSIALFEQRAREASPAFRLTDDNIIAVASICLALDGLPLAIELVAARLNVLSPNELLGRLQSASPVSTGLGAPQLRHARSRPHEALHLAAGGPRDLPARHQTLRHAIGWSYDLLNVAEQRLFRRLSVFAGGATLASIEAVCDPMDDLGIDALEGVTSLLTKNLLKRSAGEIESRIEMLETVREYSLEQLEQSGEEERRVRGWHAEYYLALVESLRPYRVGDSPGVWYDAFMRERNNLRSALGWALQAGEVEMAARMALELVEFWITGQDATEGQRAISQVLQLAETLAPEMRAKVLLQGARLFILADELDVAQRLLNAGLPSPDELDHPQRPLFLMDLGGIALRRGEWTRARSHFEDILPALREGGNEVMLIRALNDLGEVSRAEHDYLLARDYYIEALALQGRIGGGYPTAVITYNLAKVEIELGNYGRARAQLREAIAYYQRLWARAGIPACLNGVAESLVREELSHDNATDRTPGTGALSLAVELFAAAQAEHEAMGYTPEPVDLAEREQAKAAARGALGEELWEDAWERGFKLSLEQACALPF